MGTDVLYLWCHGSAIYSSTARILTVSSGLISRRYEKPPTVPHAGYVGEATIKRIVIGDNPLAFFETFGDAVFLTKEEVRAYVESQERWQGIRVRKGVPRKRPWMALKLENVRKYDTVKKPERFVPVGGRYLRE
ncbi:DUF365 domain-containing protein [Methanoculleus sp.]|uniref:DUF365 domain-containing protein n=1 Tax=Methanoculleus sp. TaxID=90427 RepID=UPI001BD35039|nr:DUF365 domain-containing protein [Methanoculleus sp.]